MACHWSVTSLSQACYKSVDGVLQVSPACHLRVMSNEHVTGVSPSCHEHVTGVSPACHRRVTCVSPACHPHVTCVSSDLLNYRSSQGCERLIHLLPKAAAAQEVVEIKFEFVECDRQRQLRDLRHEDEDGGV